MRRYPISATSKTYELKISTFGEGNPEEFLQMINKFKTGIDGTGTTTTPKRINYLRNLLNGEALRKFDELASQLTVMKNDHLNFIKEGLLGYFFNQLTFQTEVRDVPRNA